LHYAIKGIYKNEVMAAIKAIDIDILNELKSNLDIKEVAKKLGMRGSTMYYHFNKLRKDGFIKGYRVSFKGSELGTKGEYMFILLSLTSINKKNSERLFNLLRDYSSIVLDVFSISGSWDYLISVAGKKEDITKFLTKGLHSLKNIRRTYSMLVINKENI